jgi:hypothetical protein
MKMEQWKERMSQNDCGERRMREENGGDLRRRRAENEGMRAREKSENYLSGE